MTTIFRSQVLQFLDSFLLRKCGVRATCTGPPYVLPSDDDVVQFINHSYSIYKYTRNGSYITNGSALYPLKELKFKPNDSLRTKIVKYIDWLFSLNTHHTTTKAEIRRVRLCIRRGVQVHHRVWWTFLLTPGYDFCGVDQTYIPLHDKGGSGDFIDSTFDSYVCRGKLFAYRLYKNGVRSINGKVHDSESVELESYSGDYLHTGRTIASYLEEIPSLLSALDAWFILVLDHPATTPSQRPSFVPGTPGFCSAYDIGSISNGSSELAKKRKGLFITTTSESTCRCGTCKAYVASCDYSILDRSGAKRLHFDTNGVCFHEGNTSVFKRYSAFKDSWKGDMNVFDLICEFAFPPPTFWMPSPFLSNTFNSIRYNLTMCSQTATFFPFAGSVTDLMTLGRYFPLSRLDIEILVAPGEMTQVTVRDLIIRSGSSHCDFVCRTHFTPQDVISESCVSYCRLMIPMQEGRARRSGYRHDREAIGPEPIGLTNYFAKATTRVIAAYERKEWPEPHRLFFYESRGKIFYGDQWGFAYHARFASIRGHELSERIEHDWRDRTEMGCETEIVRPIPGGLSDLFSAMRYTGCYWHSVNHHQVWRSYHTDSYGKVTYFPAEDDPDQLHPSYLDYRWKPSKQ